MENFTPIASLIGGALIGLAAALLAGRQRADRRDQRHRRQSAVERRTRRCRLARRLSFGLIAALWCFGAWPARARFASMPRWPTVIAGGLLVGFGTRIGGGCTSGHGVCGLARLSPRSMAATLSVHGRRDHDGVRHAPCRRGLTVCRVLVGALVAGCCSGSGWPFRAWSIQRRSSASSISPAGGWDPSLAFVMLGALIVMAPTYALSRRLRAPLCAEKLLATGRHAHRSAPDRRRAAVRRSGWGLVGYCPGPALASIGLGRRANAAVCRRHADSAWRS